MHIFPSKHDMLTMLDVNYVMIQLQFYSEQIASTICAQSTLLILRACSYGEKLGEKEGLSGGPPPENCYIIEQSRTAFLAFSKTNSQLTNWM
jgi:hypothetical protein